MPRSTLFAYMIFKNNEINESYKLCQVSGKHTVGVIVFYKHLFLVFHMFLYYLLCNEIKKKKIKCSLFEKNYSFTCQKKFLERKEHFGTKVNQVC